MLSRTDMIILWVFYLRFSIRCRLFGSIPCFFCVSTCIGGYVVAPWRYLNIFTGKWRYLTCKLFDVFPMVQDLKGFQRSLDVVIIWSCNQDVYVWSVLLESQNLIINQILHLFLKVSIILSGMSFWPIVKPTPNIYVVPRFVWFRHQPQWFRHYHLISNQMR